MYDLPLAVFAYEVLLTDGLMLLQLSLPPDIEIIKYRYVCWLELGQIGNRIELLLLPGSISSNRLFVEDPPGFNSLLR